VVLKKEILGLLAKDGGTFIVALPDDLVYKKY
jgi:hypothetical protein